MKMHRQTTMGRRTEGWTEGWKESEGQKGKQTLFYSSPRTYILLLWMYFRSQAQIYSNGFLMTGSKYSYNMLISKYFEFCCVAH